jgi:hypothetical protein
MRVSVVVEWANTRLNGLPRAWAVLDELARQWRGIVEGKLPDNLPPEAARLLAELEPRAELIVASGQAVSAELEEQIALRTAEGFDAAVHVGEGLEYYPLKNFGAEHASGELLLFIDSDVVPEEGCLAHLLGSFARPEIHAVAGAPYIDPTDFVSRAFALGWSYEIRQTEGSIERRDKFFGNCIAFRAETFRRTGFPSIGRRTRGACLAIGAQLERLGLAAWHNGNARVAHPPPSSFSHMLVRALAQGRDQYFNDCDERSLQGLRRSQREAWQRCLRGFRAAFRSWREVGLKPWEVPGALTVIAGYHVCFALSGLLTHVSPDQMGRRFRV